MDLRFTEAEEQFRTEVREWLDENIPRERYLHIEDLTKYWEEVREFQLKLGKKGWFVAAWPKEYGGQGRSYIEQMILNEERGYRHAPFNGPAPGTIGPPIILNGTPEQKAKHLPSLASAETLWCQGFSEPNAGSDLASLQTRAVEDGDNFVVNGGKIWTSFAHYADWCYLGVRTDTEAPKHRGISVLLVDMKSPGISIRPVPNMGGYHSFNQVFFDNVVVPKANLLGEKNRGWYLMAQTLDFERSNIEGNARARRTIEELVHLANTTLDPFGRPVAADPLIWRKLTEVAIQVRAQQMICYRVVSMRRQVAMLCLCVSTWARSLPQIGGSAGSGIGAGLGGPGCVPSGSSG